MTNGYSPRSDEHKARVELFAKFWRYYEGDHDKSLVVKELQADDNITLNYSQRVVDKGVEFLFGNGVDFEIDQDNAERTVEEEYLDAAWGTDEQKAMLLQKIAMNGFVTGTAFVRIYPAEMAGDLPTIKNINPSIVDVITAEDDIDEVVSYQLIWKSGDNWKRHRIDSQENGTWFVTEEISFQGDAKWKVMDDYAWPYTFAPIIMAQNVTMPNKVWGTSDLANADLNDQINNVSSNINRILRYHAHPRTIGTGFQASALQNTAVDQFFTIPSEAANVFNLEMQSDLASSYAFEQELKDAFYEISGIPNLNPKTVNVGALSGFALRILYGDLLAKTNAKRNTYGAMLSEINTALLQLNGMGDMPVRNVWADPLPENQAEEAQTLTIDRQNGLSQETYLERRGYDLERENERIEDEAAQQGNIGQQILQSFQNGF